LPREEELSHKIEKARRIIDQVKHSDRNLLAIASLTASLNVDGHRSDLVILKASRAHAALEAFDLVPFRAAVDRAVAGIMLAHILYTGLDPKWPASLSPRIARDLLRKRMGFKGIVMTDDLEMGAIERHYGFDVTMRQVLKADIDVVLICRSQEKLERAFGVMAVKIGKSETIRRAAEASAARIMALKTHYLK
jgi:beta-N-acetylhexosaminidase